MGAAPAGSARPAASLPTQVLTYMLQMSAVSAFASCLEQWAQALVALQDGHDAVLKLRHCSCCARLQDPGHGAPVYLQVPTLALFLLSGFAVSYALSASLGDNTWGVSTGTPVS